MTPTPINPGEIYVGLATDPEGNAAHHVVLLPGDELKNWHDARDRARIANAARRRGFAVDHRLTKVYA